MEYRPLGNTGLKVSALGYGASSLGGVFGPVDDADARRCVHTALDGGVNFIDVAPYYGLTKAESALGRILKEIPRDRYVLATKVGRYGDREFDFSADRVTRGLDESLARLGVDHVDLIQVHDMEFGDLQQVIDETVPALRRIVEQGKARFVGITGLPVKNFEPVARAVPVDTILSYCHYTLNDTALLDVLPRIAAMGVGVINASPLAMGLLSTRPVPAWHPAPKNVVDACKRAATLCDERGASIEHLAVQFSVAEPRIASTFVGTASSAQMQANLDAVAEPIDRELLRDVLKVLEPIHNVTWASGRPENN